MSTQHDLHRPARGARRGPRRHEGVIRVLSLLREMEAGRTITTRWWSEQVGTTIRTARRDVAILELAGYPVYEPRPGAYRLVSRDAGDAEDDE